MRIAVLAKFVPDTEEPRELDLDTGRIDRAGSPGVLDQIDEVALEVALQVKDSDKTTEVVVVALGPAAARDAVRTCLAMGADRAVHVCDPAAENADALTTACILAGAVRLVEPDLVVAGNESTDGRCGVVPSALAELTGWPCLPSLESAQVEPGRVAGVVRDGDVQIELAAPLPAVISVTERAAEARFATLRGIMSAKRKPVDVLPLAETGYAATGAASIVLATRRRPARVAGERVAAEDDGVARLVAFLTKRHLI